MILRTISKTKVMNRDLGDSYLIVDLLNLKKGDKIADLILKKNRKPVSDVVIAYKDGVIFPIPGMHYYVMSNNGDTFEKVKFNTLPESTIDTLLESWRNQA